MEYDTAKSLVQRLVDVLPRSPFAGFIDQIGELPGLAWLNWFFPVSECLSVMVAWLAAIAVYYAISVILRWVKVIGD